MSFNNITAAIQTSSMAAMITYFFVRTVAVL